MEKDISLHGMLNGFTHLSKNKKSFYFKETHNYRQMFSFMVLTERCT